MKEQIAFGNLKKPMPPAAAYHGEVKSFPAIGGVLSRCPFSHGQSGDKRMFEARGMTAAPAPEKPNIYSYRAPFGARGLRTHNKNAVSAGVLAPSEEGAVEGGRAVRD